MFRGSQQVNQIKHLGAGVFREWIADGRVCVILSTQSGREVTDVWTTAVKKLLDQADPARPLYLIYDSSASRTSLTPYRQQKVMEIAAYRPEIRSIVAVIVQKNLFGQVMKTFIDHLSFSQVTLKVFFSRGEGEEWIKLMLRHDEANAHAASPSIDSET